jgi:hypothetical protein
MAALRPSVDGLEPARFPGSRHAAEGFVEEVLPDHGALFLAIFLLSFSGMSLEILSARVFAISQWNHLAFMVISIAMLGFAAAGTLLGILDTGGRRRVAARMTASRLTAGLTLGFSLSVLLAVATVSNLPLDYFRLPLEPIQALYLLATYLLLAVPFGLAGFLIVAAYAAVPRRSGTAYLASMTGSAGGAALPAVLLPILDETRLLVIVGLLPMAAGAAALRRSSKGSLPTAADVRFRRFAVPAALLTLLAGIWMITWGHEIMRFRPSDYKDLSQVLRLPQSRITGTRSDLRGRIDMVASPYIRNAPALSLTFTGLLPRQDAVFRDGENRLVLPVDPISTDFAFARHTLSYAAYHLLEKPRKVLILETGGGLGAACARASDAADITILDPHPTRARMIAERYGVKAITVPHRRFLLRTAEKFDLIHVESWGASLPGVDALHQEHLLTREAFTNYLERLEPEGLVTVSRRLLLPPSDSLRMWGTAMEALRATDIPDPERHLAVIRNWDTYTLIFGRAPIDTAKLMEFAIILNFDFVYLQPIDRELINRYAVYDVPYHYEALVRLAGAYRLGTQDAFVRSYPLDVAVQTDNRPFPGRFLKWSHLPELHRSTGGRTYALLLSGEIIVAVVLVEAALLASVLLVLPATVRRRPAQRLNLLRIGYFAALGSGFMFLEMYWIKRMVLVFGDPVVSFTIVLSAMLVFSGAGGYLSERMRQSGLYASLTGLIALLFIFAAGGDAAFGRLLGWPQWLLYGLALTLLAITAVPAGIPFPFAMRAASAMPFDRTYAWTVNGCASVLAVIGSDAIALSYGIGTLLVAALLSYAAALGSAIKMQWN